MMMSSIPRREMRVLSDAEIAMVAGGPGDGLNGLHDPNNSVNLTPDGVFVQSNGIIFADYTGDGIFEEAWRMNANCPTGWEQSYTGVMWFCGTSATEEYLEWLERHLTLPSVEG